MGLHTIASSADGSRRSAVLTPLDSPHSTRLHHGNEVSTSNWIGKVADACLTRPRTMPMTDGRRGRTTPYAPPLLLRPFASGESGTAAGDGEGTTGCSSPCSPSSCSATVAETPSRLTTGRLSLHDAPSTLADCVMSDSPDLLPPSPPRVDAEACRRLSDAGSAMAESPRGSVATLHESVPALRVGTSHGVEDDATASVHEVHTRPPTAVCTNRVAGPSTQTSPRTLPDMGASCTTAVPLVRPSMQDATAIDSGSSSDELCTPGPHSHLRRTTASPGPTPLLRTARRCSVDLSAVPQHSTEFVPRRDVVHGGPRTTAHPSTPHAGSRHSSPTSHDATACGAEHSSGHTPYAEATGFKACELEYAPEVPCELTANLSRRSGNPLVHPPLLNVFDGSVNSMNSVYHTADMTQLRERRLTMDKSLAESPTAVRDKARRWAACMRVAITLIHVLYVCYIALSTIMVFRLTDRYSTWYNALNYDRNLHVFSSRKSAYFLLALLSEPLFFVSHWGIYLYRRNPRRQRQLQVRRLAQIQRELSAPARSPRHHYGGEHSTHCNFSHKASRELRARRRRESDHQAMSDALAPTTTTPGVWRRVLHWVRSLRRRDTTLGGQDNTATAVAEVELLPQPSPATGLSVEAVADTPQPPSYSILRIPTRLPWLGLSRNATSGSALSLSATQPARALTRTTSEHAHSVSGTTEPQLCQARTSSPSLVLHKPQETTGAPWGGRETGVAALHRSMSEPGTVRGDRICPPHASTSTRSHGETPLEDDPESELVDEDAEMSVPCWPSICCVDIDRFSLITALCAGVRFAYFIGCFVLIVVLMVFSFNRLVCFALMEPSYSMWYNALMKNDCEFVQKMELHTSCSGWEDLCNGTFASPIEAHEIGCAYCPALDSQVRQLTVTCKSRFAILRWRNVCMYIILVCLDGTLLVLMLVTSSISICMNYWS